MKKVKENGVAPRAGDNLAEGLTGKQQAFINAYLTNGFNATDAARQAGYEGNENTLSSVGYENLRKPEISVIMNERLNEAAMSANEVMARLSEIARGEVDNFLDEDGKFDLQKARRLQKTKLLKKLKTKRTSKQVDTIQAGDEESRETLETSLMYEEVEFEMYSAHEALRDLGKYHKLLNDRHEVAGLNGGAIQVNVVYETPK